MNKFVVLSLSVMLAFLLTASSYAQQVTVNFKAEVHITESVDIAVGDIIEGTLVYDANPAPPYDWVADLSLGSKLSVNLPNGDTVQTENSANPFLNIHTNVYGYSSGIFERNTSFSSSQNYSAGALNVDYMGLYIDEVFYSAPPEFKTTWSPDLSRYEFAELYISLNYTNVHANIIEIASDAPLPPPVEEAFFTVSYSATVIESESASIAVGEQVTGTISYDVTPDVAMPPPSPYSPTSMWIDDTEPTSKMTVSFSGGVTGETSISTSPRITINTDVWDFGNGVYRRTTGFNSSSYDPNSVSSISNMHVYLNEIFYAAPEQLKTEWSSPLENYEIANLDVFINGEIVVAKINSFSTNRVVTPPTPQPDLFTVSYKAKVKESENPNVLLDSIIEGELIFDKANRDQQAYFDENTPGSMMTARFVNGNSYKTDLTNAPFVRINSYVTDFYNGNFQRDQNYTSMATSPADQYSSSYGDINLIFIEQFAGMPSYIKNNWSKPLSEYQVAEFYGYIDGQLVVADITELTSSDTTPVPEPAPEPALSINSTLSNNVLPSTGATLQITNSLTNLVDLGFSVEYWQYITMPNGMVYNVSLPSNISVVALEQQQLLASFNVPSFWPAGQYTYHIGTIIADNGAINFTTVSFVKQ